MKKDQTTSFPRIRKRLQARTVYYTSTFIDFCLIITKIRCKLIDEKDIKDSCLLWHQGLPFSGLLTTSTIIKIHKEEHKLPFFYLWFQMFQFLCICKYNHVLFHNQNTHLVPIIL